MLCGLSRVTGTLFLERGVSPDIFFTAFLNGESTATVLVAKILETDISKLGQIKPEGGKRDGFTAVYL